MQYFLPPRRGRSSAAPMVRAERRSGAPSAAPGSRSGAAHRTAPAPPHLARQTPEGLIPFCFTYVQHFPVSRAQPGSACQGAFHESPQPGLIERHLLEPAIVGLGRGEGVDPVLVTESPQATVVVAFGDQAPASSLPTTASAT